MQAGYVAQQSILNLSMWLRLDWTACSPSRRPLHSISLRSIWLEQIACSPSVRPLYSTHLHVALAGHDSLQPLKQPVQALNRKPDGPLLPPHTAGIGGLAGLLRGALLGSTVWVGQLLTCAHQGLHLRGGHDERRG
eukprot:346254-Pelagomonas_calceolata.AAC.7